MIGIEHFLSFFVKKVLLKAHVICVSVLPSNLWYKTLRSSVGNTIVGHSDVATASPVGAAPNASSFST